MIRIYVDLKDGKIVAKDGASQDMKDFQENGVRSIRRVCRIVPDGAPPSAVQLTPERALVGGSKSKKPTYARAESSKSKSTPAPARFASRAWSECSKGRRSSRNNDITLTPTLFIVGGSAGERGVS